MEELDGLQLELELLLSSVLVRQMAVNTQLTIIHQLEKGKIISKPVSFILYLSRNRQSSASISLSWSVASLAVLCTIIIMVTPLLICQLNASFPSVSLLHKTFYSHSYSVTALM